MKCPSSKTLLRMAALSAVSAMFVFAQGSKPAPSTPPGTGAPGGNTGGIPGIGTGTNNRLPNNPLPTTTQPGQSQFPGFQRPIFLQGKVMLDDGNPPGEQVMIERLCGGAARSEGYTDGKGRFSFELGRNNQMYADASTSGPLDSLSPTNGSSSSGTSRGFSERDLMGCELRASLPGYRSDILSLANRRSLDNPDVGTIILHRMSNVEGFTISMTSAMAPKEAKKAFDRAIDQVKKNKMSEAKASLEKAVQAYPKYAAAWFELGMMNEGENNVEEARKCYSEALSADSKFVKPYLQLANIEMREKKWQEVVDTTDRLVKLNPYDFPRAFYFSAIANMNLRKLDAAEKSAREAIKLDPQHTIPKSNHVLGVILANKDDYEGAAASMKAYLELVPDGKDTEFVRKQLADVEKSLAAKAGPAASNARP